jgi:hypothetical protein
VLEWRSHGHSVSNHLFFKSKTRVDSSLDIIQFLLYFGLKALPNRQIVATNSHEFCSTHVVLKHDLDQSCSVRNTTLKLDPKQVFTKLTRFSCVDFLTAFEF